MELILRARSSDGRAGAVAGAVDVAADVVVDVEPTHLVSELAHAVAAQLGGGDGSSPVTLTRTGERLDPGAQIGATGIVSGDEVTLGRAPYVQPVPPVPKRAISLDVLAGPDAGSSTTLLPGRYAIGRGADVDIRIGDPTVSRRHLDALVAGDWSVEIAPLADTANPVTINDEPIGEPTRLETHDVVGVGATRIAFRGFVRADDERRDQLGQIEFHRTPYRPPVIASRDVPDVGTVPERRDARKFQVLSALAPLLSGLAFFAFSQQPSFLVLTAMSPIVMIANYVEDKRTGRRKFEEESTQFRQRIVEWRAEIDEILEQERIERLAAAPDLADLARRAERRTVDLWARGRSAPDFLRVRLGLGDAPAGISPQVSEGGDGALRAEAVDALRGTDLIHDVPLMTDLAERGVVGIHGPDHVVSGVASSMLVQAACLHSPEDLTIVAAVDPARPISRWLKWLPHLRSVSSPIGGHHMALDADECAGLISRLLEVAEFRTDGGEREVDRRWPWILGVIDMALRPDPADVAKLLDLCPVAGISIIWLAGSAAEVPRQAAEVLVTRHGDGASLVGTLWSTDPAVADRVLEVEQIRADIADGVARALAPIRDASTASLASSIPRVAPLLDVLEVASPTPDWVTSNWLGRTGYGLPFPIGMGADGPLWLDLVEDGPHTLIGGTSGAGKSELMQSIVCSLSVHNPPDRLNFLFVDYKGGASSNVFGDLPHTVGYVTNLSAELSLRALTSLRAELNRRMQVMEGKAKDLEEMLELHPDEAPPSLVIVVDEFATLVKEVPEFVAGVVDIAQRGRSLGIHLILATQRPSGSVNENILANTNLRMSLRMLDRQESTSVIGSPEAGDIPVPLKGRAFARLGPRRLVAFQSAFCGAPLTTAEVERPVLIAPFERTTDSPKAGAGSPAGGAPTGTHLDAVLAAVSDASESLAIAEPRKPWREVLPESITLDEVLADPRAAPAFEHPGRHIAVGMLDEPERQDQSPALIDLEAGGGWLIFGSGGSGKTTTLRSVAASAASTGTPEQVQIIGFDFASRGLASLLQLPHVVDVASGDDLEAVTRHVLTLSAELARRRETLAAAHAEHLTAYNERHDPLPRIVVLIDGFGGLTAQFTGGGGGGMSLTIPLDRWPDMVGDLIVEGRQVGIHVVITSDRRASVPARIHSSVANRLILRHADEQGYAEHGVPAARANGLELDPGRGLWQAAAIVQIATVARDATGKAQGEALATLGASMRAASPSPLASVPLPETLTWDAYLAAAEGQPTIEGPLRFGVGVRDRSGAPAEVDLTWSNLLVAGAPRSGRSTTLNACAAGLAGTHMLWGVGPASSALDRTLLDEAAFGRADVITPLVDRLANLMETGPMTRPVVMLFDDVDLFDDMTLNMEIERLLKLDDLRIIGSMEARSISGYSSNPLLGHLKRARKLIYLQPDDPTDVLQATGVKAPIRPGQKMTVGRAVYVSDREPDIIQVALR